MNESVESVCVSKNVNDIVLSETLRGRRAPARLPCKDRVDVGKVPNPAVAPGDFTVLMGAVISARTLRELEEGLTTLGVAGPLSLLEWVEVELRGFDELLEELRRLRGAVTAVAAPMEGRL